MRNEGVLDKSNIDDIISLSPIQEGILFDWLRDNQSDIYFEQICIEINIDLNIQFFEKTWDVLINNNEMLRTVFRWENIIHPVQIVLKEHKIPIYKHDLSNLEEHEKNKYFEDIKKQDIRIELDIKNEPIRINLVKMSQCRYMMIISNHHIV